MPGISHKKKESVIVTGLAWSTTKNMLSITNNPTAFKLVANCAPAKTVHSTSSQGASIPS